MAEPTLGQLGLCGDLPGAMRSRPSREDLFYELHASLLDLPPFPSMGEVCNQLLNILEEEGLL